MGMSRGSVDVCEGVGMCRGGGRYVYPPPDMGPGTPTPGTLASTTTRTVGKRAVGTSTHPTEMFLVFFSKI